MSDGRRLYTGAGPALTRARAQAANKALISAVKHNRPHDVLLQLQQGADANAEATDGRPVLIQAILWRSIHLVVLLLQGGACPNVVDKKRGFSALIFSVFSQRQAIVSILLSYGARVDITGGRGHTLLHFAVMRSPRLEREKYTQFYENDRRIIARFCTTTNEPVGIVPLLMSHGTEINAANESGHSPLVLSVLLDFLGHVEALLAHPDIDKEARTVTNGKTALLYAASTGNRDMVTLLLRKGANPRTRDNSGKTPLHFSVLLGNAFTCRVLLDHDSSLALEVDHKMNSILMMGFRKEKSGETFDCEDLFRVILNRLDEDTKRRLVRHEPRNPCSALDLAAALGHSGAVRLLVPYSTNVQILSAQGVLSVMPIETLSNVKRQAIHHILFTTLVERCHGWQVRK